MTVPFRSEHVPAMRSVFLIGPMGSGKTAVGRALARRLGLDFADSDAEIESRTGVDIAYIFEREGEEGFRIREREVIDALTQKAGIVLATGGGAILLPENRERLAARGTVVFLDTTIEQQLETDTPEQAPAASRRNRPPRKARGACRDAGPAVPLDCGGHDQDRRTRTDRGCGRHRARA